MPEIVFLTTFLNGFGFLSALFKKWNSFPLVSAFVCDDIEFFIVGLRILLNLKDSKLRNFPDIDPKAQVVQNVLNKNLIAMKAKN